MTSKKKRKKRKGPSPQKGITNERLADNLKYILWKKKISKEEFARKLDEPLPYILEVLKGRRSIQLPTLIRMCKVLDVPI